MPKPRRKAPVKRRAPKNLVCFYCETKTDPNYLDYETLKKFVSERNRIMSRSRSGICAKHQRRLAQEIKRARHLALIGFKTSV